MQKKISIETVVVAVAALALFVAVLAPSTAGIAFASENSAEEESKVEAKVEWVYVPEPLPNPSEVAAKEQMKEIVEEGTKVENRSVAGNKSAAGGLYLANDVKGVAFQAAPGTSLEDTRVTTLDTDPKKSAKALECVNAAAEANGLVVGPSIDIYVQQNVAGKLQDGSFANMGTIAVGLPGNFTGAGQYDVIVVAPGGNTEVLPATLAADGKSISVDLSKLSDAAKAAKQLLVSVCKAK